MRILSFISVALLGMVFMVSANQVQARESGDWYASFSAGVVIPQNSELSGRLTGEFEYDPGYDISGAVGLYMGSNFRLELAIGGREYDFSDVNASRSAVSFMTNGYWDILGVSNPFEPYVGFGVGVASWEFDGAVSGDRIAAFMVSTMVGANYHINDHLAFGTSYRFAYSNPEDDVDLLVEEFNHSILGTVTVVF